MKNVLLVDDEKAYLLSLSEGLRSFYKGMCVITAENALQAIDILESRPVDILVTDLRMPVLDGYDLLLYMGINYPDIPVLVVTALSSPDLCRRLECLGVKEYMEKPVEFLDVAGRIGSLLKHSNNCHY